MHLKLCFKSIKNFVFDARAKRMIVTDAPANIAFGDVKQRVTMVSRRAGKDGEFKLSNRFKASL